MTFNFLSIFAGFVYILLGIVVVIYRSFIVELSKEVAYPLGAVFIFYGIFRIGRAFYKYKNRHRDEE